MSHAGTVYLAGPISGLNFQNCTAWRKDVAAELAEHNIHSYSPLRGKEYLEQIGILSGHGKEYAHLGVLSSAAGVMTRDRFDATRCDVLFVNFLGCTQVSIGTCMEIAWADAARIPIVLAMEAEHAVHEHMMITQAAGFRVHSLADAVHVTIAILKH